MQTNSQQGIHEAQLDRRAVILLGVNVARYVKHIAASGFSVVLGAAALVAAVSQMWRTDPPLVAIFLLVIGASLVAKPLFTRTA